MFPSLHTPPAHDVMIFTAINSTVVGNLRHNHIGRIIILILIVTDNLLRKLTLTRNMNRSIRMKSKPLQSNTVQSNILIIILLVFTDSTGGNNSNSN